MSSVLHICGLMDSNYTCNLPGSHHILVASLLWNAWEEDTSYSMFACLPILYVHLLIAKLKSKTSI